MMYILHILILLPFNVWLANGIEINYQWIYIWIPDLNEGSKRIQELCDTEEVHNTNVSRMDFDYTAAVNTISCKCHLNQPTSKGKTHSYQLKHFRQQVGFIEEVVAESKDNALMIEIEYFSSAAEFKIGRKKFETISGDSLVIIPSTTERMDIHCIPQRVSSTTKLVTSIVLNATQFLQTTSPSRSLDTENANSYANSKTRIIIYISCGLLLGLFIFIFAVMLLCLFVKRRNLKQLQSIQDNNIPQKQTVLIPKSPKIIPKLPKKLNNTDQRSENVKIAPIYQNINQTNEDEELLCSKNGQESGVTYSPIDANSLVRFRVKSILLSKGSDGNLIYADLTLHPQIYAESPIYDNQTDVINANEGKPETESLIYNNQISNLNGSAVEGDMQHQTNLCEDEIEKLYSKPVKNS